MPSFDLIDEPWIPYLLPDGSKRLGGIREVLIGAQDIREISDVSPLVTAALHRMLLAMLHRVFGPEDEGAWADLWNAGAFDADELDRYLERWRHRFDLFHETHPFYQNAELDPDYASSVTKLPLSAGKREALFEHFVADDSFSLSVPEAACQLVALHAFAVGGLLSYERHLDPRLYKSAKGGPLAKAAVAIVKGENLFQTLMLNMCRYSPADEEPFPVTGDDVPAWERDEPTRAGERSPTGYLDLLTWQSRRVRLLPELASEGTSWVVRRVVVMKGYQFPDSWSQRRETMVAFQKRRNARPDEQAYLPVSFQRDRALWRDSLALLRLAPDPEERLKTVSWVADLVTQRLVSRSAIYNIDLAGLNTDQALVYFWRYERLPLPLAYLENQDLVDQLGRALDLAEQVGGVVRGVVASLAKLLLSPTANEERGRQPERSDINNLTKHLGTERLYWAQLETPFKRFVVDLAAEHETDEEGSSRERDRVLASWADELRRAARSAFEETARGVGSSARHMKAVAEAEMQLVRRLAHVLKGVVDDAAKSEEVMDGATAEVPS